MDLSLGALPDSEVPLGVVTRDVHGAGPRRRGDREARCGDAADQVPGVGPKSTAVAPVKLVPLTVTEVPRPVARWSG